jgi:hypothetical protein
MNFQLCFEQCETLGRCIIDFDNVVAHSNA